MIRDKMMGYILDKLEKLTDRELELVYGLLQGIMLHK